MSTELTKKKTAIIPPKEPKALAKKSERHFQPGDLLIDGNGRTMKVGKCTAKGYETLYDRSGEGNWTHYGSHTWDEKPYGGEYLKLEKSQEEYKRELLAGLSNGFEAFTAEPAMNSSTDLVAGNNKEMAGSAKRVLEEKHKHLAILSRTLDTMRSELNGILSDFRKKVEAVTRIVDIIEIYLGVHEHVVQIQEGEPAPASEPITFRQLVLHMDEEVGEDIDFTDVEKFDAYAREHTDQILPEAKGVVVMRPRRKEKRYGDDPLVNAKMNEGNRETYVLIRNGDNLYRIFTPLVIYPHLFPSAEELRKLMESTEKWGYEKEDAEKAQLGYKRNILLLQGLLERTQVFHPVPPGLNLLQSKTYGKSLRFIYDGSNLLPSGRMSWKDYLKAQNAKLERGSRVYFVGFPWGLFSHGDGTSGRDYEEERFRYPTGVQTRPPAGVYNIRDVKPTTHYVWDEKNSEPKRRFYLNFNPKDEVYDWKRGVRGRERLRAISFCLHSNDEFMLNYDNLSLEDLDFYINDRVNRVDYAEMLPIFRGIKKMRLKEIEWENNFVRFLSDKLAGPEPKASDPKVEAAIREGIEWWKNKVIEKRPLKKEDAKAVRMIKSWVLKRLGTK